MIEIERTYLVKKLPDLETCEKTLIRQGYYSGLPSPLRIRQQGDKLTLTKKLVQIHGDQSTHDEINLSIKPEEFKRLWPTATKSLEKTRYLVPLLEDLIAEVDVFHGKLEGLVLVEVEFPSREAMEIFVPPEWFGRDVTDEDFSVNSFLAEKSFEEIKRFL